MVSFVFSSFLWLNNQLKEGFKQHIRAMLNSTQDLGLSQQQNINLEKPTDKYIASQTTKHDLNVMLMEEICQDIIYN